MNFDEIDTVGTVAYGGVVTSGNRTMKFASHGGSAADVVAWIRLQIDSNDNAVNIRSLPRPEENAVGSSENARESVGGQPLPQLGVADEIRKLGDLLHDGLLTEEEFAEQKQRLLGS